jgi:hypothetical protein
MIRVLDVGIIGLSEEKNDSSDMIFKEFLESH